MTIGRATGWSAVLAAAVLSVTACGGGGGGSPPAGAPAQDAVVVAGKAAAPDGTVVDLTRASAAAEPGAVIASTTVRQGLYRFDLTALGEAPGAGLMLRMSPAGGPVQRAFAAAAQVDLGVGTEAFVQAVRQRIDASPGASAAGLTATEAAGLQGTAHVLALLEDPGPGVGTQAAIDTARARMVDDARFRGAIDAALNPSVSLDGPGDLLDLVPLAVGNRWAYESSDGQRTTQAGRQVRVAGDDGLVEIAGDDGSVERYVRRGDGLYVAPDPQAADDPILAQIGAYPAIDFPPVPGRERTVKSAAGATVPDQDGDGRPESMDFVLTRREGVVTSTLPSTAPMPRRAVEITDTVSLTLRLSGGIVVIASAASTTAFVPRVGPATESTVFSTSASGPGTSPVTSSQSERLTLTGWFKAPVAVPVPHRRAVFDAARGVAYASVPTGAGTHADRVVTVDPKTRSVTAVSAPFATGADPDLLAIGGDGRSLFVSLRGTGAVARLALPSLALLQVFDLAQAGDLHAPWRAASLATSPALPDAVAVSLSDALGATEGIGLYSGGVRLPNRGGCAAATSGDTCRIVFSPGLPTRLFALDDNTTRNTLVRHTVSGAAGLFAEASGNAPDIVPTDSVGRFWNGLSEPGWLPSRMLAPDGAIYDDGSLQRLGGPAPDAAGCIALTRAAWFGCRDRLLTRDIVLRELMADSVTQRPIARYTVPGLVSRSARLVDLGPGLIGISDAPSDAAAVFDRLLLIEGGPF
jgi:hypothetical protein